VLHAKEYSIDHSRELAVIQLKAALGAMFYDVLDQLEKCLPKLWILRCIVLKDVQSRLAQCKHDLFQELFELGAHLFEQARE